MQVLICEFLVIADNLWGGFIGQPSVDVEERGGEGIGGKTRQREGR